MEHFLTILLLTLGYKDTVSPASSSQAPSPGFSAKNKKEETAAQSKTVRAKRLMKEFRDLQR